MAAQHPPTLAAPRVAHGSAPEASAARIACWVLMAAAGGRGRAGCAVRSTVESQAVQQWQWSMLLVKEEELTWKCNTRNTRRDMPYCWPCRRVHIPQVAADAECAAVTG